eukprot:TRINITY_DN1897_c0_g1_i2.p1 TRINITY_DN1897_c0_g1~~TRINITY_DN1897_c0_g1_i2.p1  ORF type:complete len:134 (-),score=8.08 TRINITY_DN1897_c0_g1_i2:139-540(-)
MSHLPSVAVSVVKHGPHKTLSTSPRPPLVFDSALESGANLQAGPSTGEAQRPRSQTQIEQIQLLQTYQDRLETSKPQFMDTDDGYSSSDSNGGGKNRQLALRYVLSCCLLSLALSLSLVLMTCSRVTNISTPL